MERERWEGSEDVLTGVDSQEAAKFNTNSNTHNMFGILWHGKIFTLKCCPDFNRTRSSYG